MSQLVKISLSSEISSNPKKISDMILTIAQDIEECKENLMTIKNRDTWQKMFSSNTRDLADAILKQNDTIAVFLYIVQSLIMINMHNIGLLNEVQKELCKHETTKGHFQNKYLEMAKEFISESYRSSLSFKNNVDKLDDNFELIKSDFAKTNELDKKQNQYLFLLRSKLEDLVKLFNDQSISIQSLNKRVTDYENDRAKQQEIISQLRTLINKFEQIIASRNETMVRFEKSLMSNSIQIKQQHQILENYHYEFKLDSSRHNNILKNIILICISYGLLHLILLLIFIFNN